MLLGEMQPDAQRHRCGGDQQPSADGLTQDGNGQDGAEKRRYGEVGPGSGGPEMPQADHEKGQAHAISQPR